MDLRKIVAEFLGTALLVIFAVGTATLSFGFLFTGASVAAGVVATSFAFGLVLLALAYTLGPLSGCHVNPAVTIGFVASGRMHPEEGIAYWIAQFSGGMVGAAALFGIFQCSPLYTDSTGLGANGWGNLSFVQLNVYGAFISEVVLTFLFVLVVLGVTSRLNASPALAGVAIGIALTVVHLVGIPLTGTSVNPARSLGPALVVQGEALEQVWLFILAPLVGGVIAALVYRYLFAGAQDSGAPDAVVVEEVVVTEER